MQEKNFEQSMQDLEKIVTELEKGDLNLDESVKKFEEGMKIAKQCNNMLEEAEKKFQEVLEDEELSADAYYELSKIYLMKGNKDIAIKYANTAIDVDSKKIVEKIKKDPIFIPIFAKLSIPFNLEEKENETKNLSEIEIKSKEHLEEMVEITRSLSYQDIDLLKTKIHNKEKIIEQENEYEKDEKERH